MTAMIDVVFLLLVFFVWTARIDRPEFNLHGGLATVQSIAPDQAIHNTPSTLVDELIIHIQAAEGRPRYVMSGQTFTELSELSRRLNAVRMAGAHPPVIVHPDSDVPLAMAIEVYDRVLLAGLTEVLFAAAP